MAHALDLPARETAWELLCEFTQSAQLRKHALGVEAVMRHFARRLGAGDSEDLWALVGLLHDFDYERYPNPPDHPLKGAEVLAARGYPELVIRAIKCHAPYLGLARETALERAIFALDELTGFVVAVALVRPQGLDGLEARSVVKKLKDRRFASGVSRDDVLLGAEELGMPLEEIVTEVIAALRAAEAELARSGRTLLAGE